MTAFVVKPVSKTVDWSIKGKGLYDYPDIDSTIQYFNKRLKEEREHELRCGCDVQSYYKEYKTEDNVSVYLKEDIMTLREKLIEDIKNLFIQAEINHDLAFKGIEFVVNKRFGYNEKKK